MSSFVGRADGIVTLIVAVVFVAIEVGRLSAVAGIVEEKGVVGACVANEPGHGAEYVGLGWDGHWVLLVVCEKDLKVLSSEYVIYARRSGRSYHVFPLVAEVIVEICGHILHIVDAPP